MKPLLILLMLMAVGCVKPDGLQKSNGNFYYEVATIKEHEYIIATKGSYEGGAGIIHSESCPNPIHKDNCKRK